ncbi:MAG: hypothetical protein ACYDD1_22185 [Caulobacteraceae bacterium]
MGHRDRTARALEEVALDDTPAEAAGGPPAGRILAAGWRQIGHSLAISWHHVGNRLATGGPHMAAAGQMEKSPTLCFD